MAENTIAKTTENGTTEVTTHEATREPDRYVTPAVDIFETKDGLHVLADLPGVASDRIDIAVEDSVLTIKGTVPEREGGEAPEWQEYQLGSYFRQFQLGEKIDQEKIQAEYRQGVLKLTLPFAEAAKPRRIEVRMN